MSLDYITIEVVKNRKYDDIPDNMLLHFYSKNFPKLLENNFKNVIVNRELVKEGKKLLMLYQLIDVKFQYIQNYIKSTKAK